LTQQPAFFHVLAQRVKIKARGCVLSAFFVFSLRGSLIFFQKSDTFLSECLFGRKKVLKSFEAKPKSSNFARDFAFKKQQNIH